MPRTSHFADRCIRVQGRVVVKFVDILTFSHMCQLRYEARNSYLITPNEKRHESLYYALNLSVVSDPPLSTNGPYQNIVLLV